MSARPNFLFIGPDKSGSTWLYNVLKQHPQAFVPLAKDIYFFDQNYQRGWQWYEQFFADAPEGARAIGELSHDYLFSAEAAERISGMLPEVRLLASLRDPVERSFSQYLYLLRSGVLSVSFEDAIQQCPRIVDNSRYARHLAPYFRLFPRDQIRILWFQDLQADPVAYAGRVFEFLDIEHRDDIDYHARVRPASAARSAWLAKLMKQGASLARALGRPGLVGAIKHSRVDRLLYRRMPEADRPRMTDETRVALRRLFRPDVEDLETLLGVDLSDWKET